MSVLKTVCDAAEIEFRRRFPEFESYLSNMVREEWNSYLKTVYEKEKIIDDLSTPEYSDMDALIMKARDDVDVRISVREYLRNHPEGMAILFKDKFSDSRLINAYIKALGVMLYLSGDYYMDSPEVRAGVEFLSRTTFGPLGKAIFNTVQNYITAKRLDISQRSLEELSKDFAENMSLIACVSETLRQRATFNKKGFIDIALSYVEGVMEELQGGDVEEIVRRIDKETRDVLEEIPQKVEDVEKFLESVRMRLKADEGFMKRLSDLEGVVQKTSAYRSLNNLADDLVKVACAERLAILEGGKVENGFIPQYYSHDGSKKQEVVVVKGVSEVEKRVEEVEKSILLLAEHQKKLEEKMRRIEELQKKLEERQRELEEKIKTLERRK